MLLGRLVKPNTSSTERANQKAYHLRLSERDAIVRPDAERMRGRVLKVACAWIRKWWPECLTPPLDQAEPEYDFKQEPCGDKGNHSEV